MLNGLMNIFSAPAGALLVAALPMGGVLMVDIGTALLAILPLLFIRVPQPARRLPAEAEEKAPSMLADLRAGLSYVWGWPGLMAILIMATLINLVTTPAFALLPILVTRYFGGGAAQLAWMESAWGIGVVAGGLLLSVWGGFKRRIVTSMFGLIMMGGLVIGIGLAPGDMFPMAVALLFAAGIFNPIVNGPLFAVVQAVVAPNMQGRVFTLIGSFATAMTPIGLIFAGPLADRFGVPIWYVFGGLVTALLGVSGFLIPAVMNVESGSRAVAHPADRQAEVLSPGIAD